jgi:hypothetical protein
VSRAIFTSYLQLNGVAQAVQDLKKPLYRKAIDSPTQETRHICLIETY